MYRAGAIGIRGSKCGDHSKICSVAISSLSSGLNDPCSNELHPSHAPVVTSLLLSDELGTSYTPPAIDLEARGFAILGQNSFCNQWKKQATVTEDHRGLTFGGSTSKMFEMKSNIFQRGFSSHEQEAEEKVPVIRQLICHDEYDLKNTKLVPLRECLLEKTIVKPISPAGLFEQADLLKFGNLVFGDLSRPVLRQLARLATVNLMRGLNIMKPLQNVHMMLAEKSTLECLEISTGITLEKVRLPEEVTNYLLLLKNAKQVDKRLITNHSATKYPWERMQRNSRLNQLLRQDLPKHILKTTTDEDQLLIKSCAENVFTDLAFEFPLALLMSRGLQKVVNHWAREGQSMRGIKAGESPVVLPNSTIEGLRAGSIKDVYELIAAIEQDPGAPVELSKIMVALHRDPFEHLYEPLKRGLWPRSYNVLDVEQLLNGVNPAFGPTVERSFLERGMWHLWDVNPGSKPPYLYWTNVNWAPNRSEEN